jgi:RES domain-containing protein
VAASGKRRDSKLIDAIEAIAPVEYLGPVWRIVREGRDPTQCPRSGGRWDDGTFDVLYTSERREGALAEMKFHLLRGQPVIPSLVKYRLHELAVSMKRALRLLDLETLAALGLDTARYGQLSYAEKAAEYPRAQDIAETAFFLDFDGLVVPSARYACQNVVLFCEKLKPGAIVERMDHGLVDWANA